MLNYLRNLYHVFTLLGVMFFFALLGLTITLPMTGSAIANLIDAVKKAIADTELNLYQFAMALAFNVQDKMEAGTEIGEFFNPELIGQILKETLKEAIDVDTLSEALGTAIQTCVSDLLLAISVFFLWFALGVVVGTLLVRFVVRRSIAKRGFLAGFVTFFVNPIVSILLIVFFVWLFMLFNNLWAGLILLVVYWVLATTISFFEAWVIHGHKKKMRLRDAFHIKNFLAVFFTFFLIIAVAVGFFAGMVYLTNIITAATLSLPLLLLTLSVLSLNAESTVRGEAMRLGLAVDKQIPNPIHEIEEVKGDEEKKEGE